MDVCWPTSTPVSGEAIELLTTSTAKPLVVVVSFPNWPAKLYPQHLTPPDTSAHAWYAPALTRLAPVRVGSHDCSHTATGLEASMPVLSSPSWPDELSPQHFTPPPE